MIKDYDDLDKLAEELTLEKTFEPCRVPPFGGFHGWSVHHYGKHWYKLKDKPQDICYRNKEGQYHRLYGPAYISNSYDLEIWYKEGQLHRLNGPAISHSKNCYWYKEGQLHRLDGPAVVELNGPKQYWIDGVRLSPKEFKREVNRRNKKVKNEKF